MPASRFRRDGDVPGHAVREGYIQLWDDQVVWEVVSSSSLGAFKQRLVGCCVAQPTLGESDSQYCLKNSSPRILLGLVPSTKDRAIIWRRGSWAPRSTH